MYQPSRNTFLTTDLTQQQVDAMAEARRAIAQLGRAMTNVVPPDAWMHGHPGYVHVARSVFDFWEHTTYDVRDEDWRWMQSGPMVPFWQLPVTVTVGRRKHDSTLFVDVYRGEFGVMGDDVIDAIVSHVPGARITEFNGVRICSAEITSRRDKVVLVLRREWISDS